MGNRCRRPAYALALEMPRAGDRRQDHASPAPDPQHDVPRRGCPFRGPRLVARRRRERDRWAGPRALCRRGQLRRPRAPLSAIVGLVRLDGPEIRVAELEAMRAPMAYWGPD